MALWTEPQHDQRCLPVSAQMGKPRPGPGSPAGNPTACLHPEEVPQARLRRPRPLAAHSQTICRYMQIVLPGPAPAVPDLPNRPLLVESGENPLCQSSPQGPLAEALPPK